LQVQRSSLASLDLNTAKLPAKQRQAFYGSAEWRALVAILRSARGDRCEVCGRTGTRMFADHVVELQDGGAALDIRNLMLKCGACHGRKTAIERARRLAAQF
jgi:5-methylcytosine-specific restriction endonuclease McrA